MTTPPQYQKILGYIDIAKGEGAKCVLGGGPATKEEGGGKYFVKPTIFTGVDNKMRIAQEEVFGPVLSVIKFKDEDDAVRIANDIAYGLGAGVWTQSVKRAHTMARKIKAGTVWVNTYRAVSFMMPFGGYKASGLGRENGAEAIEGYLQTKSVWINNGPGGGNPFVMKTVVVVAVIPGLVPESIRDASRRSARDMRWSALIAIRGRARDALTARQPLGRDDLDGDQAAVAQDVHGDALVDARAVEHAGDVVDARHGFLVEADDHVARLQPAASGRAARLHLHDAHAGLLREAGRGLDPLRQAHLVAGDAEPRAAHAAVLQDLRQHMLRGVGRRPRSRCPARP